MFKKTIFFIAKILAVLFLLTSCSAVNTIIDKISKDNALEESDKLNPTAVATESDAEETATENEPLESAESTETEGFFGSDSFSSDNVSDENDTNSENAGIYKNPLLIGYNPYEIVPNKVRIQVPDDWYGQKSVEFNEEIKSFLTNEFQNSDFLISMLETAAASDIEWVWFNKDNVRADTNFLTNITCIALPKEDDDSIASLTDADLAGYSESLRNELATVSGSLVRDITKSKIGNNEFILIQAIIPVDEQDTYTLQVNFFTDTERIIIAYRFADTNNSKEHINTFTKILETIEIVKN